MSSGIEIELKNNFAWAEDSVLLFTTHGCIVILQGDEENDKHFFITLDFHNVQCVRSASTGCSPSINIEPKTIGASFIAILTNYTWEKEALKAYTYTGALKLTELKHFVITNHDVFHEFLGTTYEEKRISKTDNEYEFIKSLYLFSKVQIV